MTTDAPVLSDHLNDSRDPLLADAVRRADRVRKYVRDTNHGCRMGEYGDKCDCPLCDANVVAFTLRRIRNGN